MRGVCAFLGFKSLWVGGSSPISSGIIHGAWGGELPYLCLAFGGRSALGSSCSGAAVTPSPSPLTHPTAPKPPENTKPLGQRSEIPNFPTAFPWSCTQGLNWVS